jgi:hypothetical protein
MSATVDLLNGVVRSLRGFRIDETVHASRGGKAYPKEVGEHVREAQKAIDKPFPMGLGTLRSRGVVQNGRLARVT